MTLASPGSQAGGLTAQRNCQGHGSWDQKVVSWTGVRGRRDRLKPAIRPCIRGSQLHRSFAAEPTNERSETLWFRVSMPSLWEAFLLFHLGPVQRLAKFWIPRGADSSSHILWFEAFSHQQQAHCHPSILVQAPHIALSRSKHELLFLPMFPPLYVLPQQEPKI